VLHNLQLAQGAGVPTFNDDIQATAAVAVAAVLGGVQVPGVLPLTEQRWLFFGAGQVGVCCCHGVIVCLNGIAVTHNVTGC
jgi:malic enzyme